MSTALQDRPSTAAPSCAPHRRRGSALLVTLVVLGGTAVVGVDRALDALGGLGTPFEQTVVDRSRPALLESLSDLDDFHAASGEFQVVVDLERDVRWVPSWVTGERTTYLAVGSVDGLVDFGALGGDAVETDGTSATITLPAPRLDEARIDLTGSRLLDRDRGVVDRLTGVLRDDPTSEREVVLAAQDDLAAAAAESDLLRRARANTRTMLTGLAGSFGYDDVTVRFEDVPRDRT